MNDQDHLKTLETLKDDLRTTCSGCEVCGFEGDESCLTDWSRNVKDALSFAITAIERSRSVDVLLYCPNCFEQHVDEAKPDVCELCGDNQEMHGKNRDVGILCEVFTPWLNPDHKSHRCNFCNHVWRPADVPTNGVLKLESKGERDGSPRPTAFANGKDFQDSVDAATAIERSRWVAEIEEPHQCPHCKSMIAAEWLAYVEEDGKEPFYSCSICDYEPLHPYTPKGEQK